MSVVTWYARGGGVEELVRRHLGEPNGRLSDPRRGDLRYGRKGSLSVKVPPHPKAGAWFDHEAGVGGGPAALRAYLESGVAPAPARVGTGEAGSRPERSYSGASVWERSVSVEGIEPVRAWLAARALWRPELRAPACVRWLPGQDGGGRVVALAAEPRRWIEAWPGLPEPQAVQRIPVSRLGEPAGAKKSLGRMYGAVMVIGQPGGADGRSASVCEGVADGLALASRCADTVVVVFGTAAMQSAGRNGVAEYLASFGEGVVVWADRDDPSEGGKAGRRSPAGARAGWSLARAVRDSGGDAVVRHVGGGCKDLAERTAQLGFGRVDAGVLRSAVAELREEGVAWPEWELWRQASMRAAGEG